MITLRSAAPEDAEALLEIYRPYVEETTITFETTLPTRDEFAGRIRDTIAMYPYLVAEEDGSPVGYAYAHRFRDRAAYDWSVETSVYVKKDKRGKGIGALLYRRLIAELDKQGVALAVAVITVPNDPSIAFHTAMGFSMAGILPHVGYKMGRWCGTAYMYLRPTDGEKGPLPLSPWEKI